MQLDSANSRILPVSSGETSFDAKRELLLLCVIFCIDKRVKQAVSLLAWNARHRLRTEVECLPVEWLCTKSRFISPQSGRNDSSPAVYCWDKEGQGSLVREADNCM